MKKYLSIAILLFFTACSEERPDNTQLSSSSETAHPQLDERVVAYMGGSCGINEIITDMDSLKVCFEVALNEENFDPECDYFAIQTATGEYLTHFVVSRDKDALTVYHIYPSWEQPLSTLGDGYDVPSCMYPAMPQYFRFLICDKEGGLKNKVNYPPAINYYDPDWECWGGKPEPEKLEYFEFRKQ
jgi:hypothetical protein